MYYQGFCMNYSPCRSGAIQLYVSYAKSNHYTEKGIRLTQMIGCVVCFDIPLIVIDFNSHSTWPYKIRICAVQLRNETIARELDNKWYFTRKFDQQHFAIDVVIGKLIESCC